MQYYQFQIVTVGSTLKILQQDLRFVSANLLIILLVYFVLSFFVKKTGIALIIMSVISTIWSIAHHYVVLLHGSPLFFTTLASAGAAMNVLGSYTLEISMVVKRLILCFIVLLFLAVVILLVEIKFNRKSKRNIIFSGSLTLTCGLLIWLLMFSPVSIRPEQMIKFSWKEAITNYGFFVCAIEDLENAVTPFAEPEGYRSEAIELKEKGNVTLEYQKPDVILILNETFYNLDFYTDVNTNKEYLKEFNQVENAIRGYAVVSSSGGGTNNSEFELLTSNSMYLLNNDAPFNYMDMSKSNNNAVQYFKTLGYSTLGYHGADENNYSRKRAYPELGFDNSLLGWETSEYNFNGNRPRLDEDDYSFIIEQYEKMGSMSRFMYCLTYQNHGGYEQNEDADDIIRTQNNYGELTDDVNEYLTSVSLSSDAFKEMIDYYSKCERPVLICMVGDHAPAFINQLKTELSEEEKELYSRMVPYIIWSNYEVEFPEYTEYVSLTDLVPMIIKIAELPLTIYHEQVLEVQSLIPIRTSYGKYYNEKLEEVYIEKGSVEEHELEQYYYMEYNSLKAGDELKTELFMP